MPDLAEVLARLDHLESKDSIRALCSSYAAACDEHDIPRLTSLFTKDACFDAANGTMVAQGRAAIVAMFTNTFKSRGPGYHWTHDIVVTVDAADPDRASGLVFSHAETSPHGVVSLAAMRYHDTYQRSGERWQFSGRKIEFLYYVPAAEFAQGLNQVNRVVMNGQRMPADYPESAPHWRAFLEAHGTES